MTKFLLRFFKARNFDEVCAENQRLMQELRKARHDLSEVTKDRDLVGQVGLQRLAMIRQRDQEIIRLRGELAGYELWCKGLRVES